MSEKYKIFTDGGSRGNPGPSAIGVVIENEDNSQKWEYGEYIGEGTNNEAEYKAVIFALGKLKSLVGKDKAKNVEVNVFVDSELLAKQLNHEYRVKDKKMQDLFMEIHNKMFDFGKVTFQHVYREENKEADALVNAALDKETNKLL